MKYNLCLGVFLILLLSTANLANELTKKPKSAKGKGKKAKSSRKSQKVKKLYRPKKDIPSSLESPVDLDVKIRMRFARYGTNMLANFAAGILSAFYNNQFQFLQKQEKSNRVLRNHLRCVRKELGPLFNNNQLIRVFTNKLLFGGLYPFKKQISKYFIFTHRYKKLRRKNRILAIIRRLRRVTGTHLKNEEYRQKKRRIKKLYRNKRRVGRAAGKILKLDRLSKKQFIKKQKKITRRSFANFKLRSYSRRIKKWKRRLRYGRKLEKIIGKHSYSIISHAKFMTYAFRKIWFYSSFFTRKVLSCGVSAASKYRSISKRFLHIFQRSKRIACPYNFVDVLATMFKSYTVRHAFNRLFYRLLVKGVKTRLLYRVNWYRIGQALFNAHSVLEKLCPWF